MEVEKTPLIANITAEGFVIKRQGCSPQRAVLIRQNVSRTQLLAVPRLRPLSPQKRGAFLSGKFNG